MSRICNKSLCVTAAKGNTRSAQRYGATHLNQCDGRERRQQEEEEEACEHLCGSHVTGTQ
jgi:hypothetical protein